MSALPVQKPEFPKPELPKLSDLMKDVDMAYAENDYNILVNTHPKDAWVEKHPVSKIPYIPIARVEWLLTSIFGRWHVEILSEKLEANSIVVTVRLHYLHPDGSWRWTDGIGACPIQTKSGAGAADFMQMQTNGVQLAAPAAKSYAIKDAAETIGRIFGKDISRKTQTDYSFLVARRKSPELRPDMPEFQKAVEHIRRGGTLDEITQNWTVSEETETKLLDAV